MSNLSSFSSKHTASGARNISSLPRFTPLALLLVSSLGLFATGCGGGSPYVAVGPPCYGYGCGYGFGPGYGYGYGYAATVAGNGIPGNSGNGAAAVKAQLSQPVAVAVDSSGNLYIADRASNTVREVAASTQVINSALSGAAASGTATSGATSANLGKGIALARPASANTNFNHPSAVAIDPAGNIYIMDQASSTVRRISASTGAIGVVAGTVGYSGFTGDNGQATSAQLNLPSGMALDTAGNLYIADTLNHRIRKVDASTGVIATVAGDGTPGYSGDGGPAAAAELSHPGAIAVDSKGNLYIADTANAVIRKIDVRTGIISTVAGNGTIGFSGDSAAASAAQLNGPQGITVDPDGNLFIADTGNQRIREVASRTGIISTIAGQNKGYSGDGGPSSQADLNNPSAIAFDASGNLYIADSGNGAIRKILPNPQTASKSN